MRTKAASQGAIAVTAGVATVALLLILTTNSVVAVQSFVGQLLSFINQAYSYVHCFGAVPGC